MEAILSQFALLSTIFLAVIAGNTSPSRGWKIAFWVVAVLLAVLFLVDLV